MVRCFVELLRPVNSVMAAVAVLVGAIVVAGTYSAYMTDVHLAIIATFVITSAGMVINDFCDRDIDFLNKRKRPIPSGRVSPKGALVISFVLFAVGVYMAYYINLYCFLIAFVNSAFLFIYSLKAKKMPLIGHLFVSYLVSSSFLFGGFAVNLDNMIPVTVLALLSFFANMSREIVKTIEDIKGDRVGKVKSLPIIFGEKNARRIASMFMAISILLAPLPYLLGYMDEIYMYLVSIGVILFIFSVIWNERQTPAGRVHKLMKVAMVFSLFAFLVGAVV